jgi:bifunctional NMN adenylyltransferase/nudix hydrolase
MPVVTNTTLSAMLSVPVISYMNEWMQLPDFEHMQQEHLALEQSKQKWGNGPFITVDAVVTASKHVLLVKRGGTLGKGLWAIPGGFLEARERLLQGAIRELKEETGFSMSNVNMEHCLKGVAVFDHADRSLRGRTITHAHWFDLGEFPLPVVAGADDAVDAQWVPMIDLAKMEALFFEDHYSILRHFLF